MKKIWNRLFLWKKIMMIVGFSFAVLMWIYLLNSGYVSKLSGQMFEVYEKNSRLGEVSESVTQVQGSMIGYLDTKSSDSLEEYFRYCQILQNHADELNQEIMDDPMLLLEKNIRGMIENYLDVTREVVYAKRGRDVQKYSEQYEDAAVLYEEMRLLINSLNTLYFEKSYQDFNVLKQSTQKSMTVNNGIFVMTIAATLLFIGISVRTLTKPLMRLSRAADKVGSGEFDIELSDRGTEDELGIVTKAFNNMVVRIREYIEKIKESMEQKLLMQSLLKDTQLKYLQAQIQPHFLFNTLNAGVQLALMEGADRTGEYIEKLAAFFRYNLKNMYEDSTVGREIELVETYLYIMNVRYAGDIGYKKDADPLLLSVRMPAMILQALVENAIGHGIQHMAGNGKIMLTVREESGFACIHIADNGNGMTQERISQILYQPEEKISQSAEGSEHIGIRNVKERLEFYYKREDVFFIESAGTGCGTIVIIRIPLLEYEEGE